MMDDMNRREALMRSAGAALTGMQAVRLAAAAALPSKTLLEKDAEQYWKQIRTEQFLLPDWRVFLNNGSLGIAPKPVLSAVTDYLTQSAALTMDEYPRWGYETLDAHRTEMAAYLGCSKDNIAFMHNATEAMSSIADGLQLKAGDEVVITDQEHPSGRFPWLKRQARDGIAVKEAKIPLPPKSFDQLTDAVISAIGPRTRVLSFSGILTTTGLIMPIRRICDAARSKGVITVVDGAHMIGQVPVNVPDLGCDLFAGSPHKWLFTPAGCGLLYLRDEMLDRLWPSTVTGNWDNRSLKAARFMMIGTNNRAILEGMLAGLHFHQSIGSERIYGRIHQLAAMVRQRAASSPLVELLTPADDRMYGSLVSIKFKEDPKAFFALCRKRKIWTQISNPLRISTHIHTRPADIDTLFATIDEAMGKG